MRVITIILNNYPIEGCAGAGRGPGHCNDVLICQTLHTASCVTHTSLLTSDKDIRQWRWSPRVWRLWRCSVFTVLVTRDNNNPASSQRHRALTGEPWFHTMSELMTQWPAATWGRHVERRRGHLCSQMENWAYQLTKERNNRKMRSAYIHNVLFLMMLLCS